MDILAKYDEKKDDLAAMRAMVEREVATLDSKDMVLYNVGRAVGLIDSLGDLMENIKENDGAGVDIEAYGSDLIREALDLVMQK